MRIIHYGVFNKETGKRIYIDCRRYKCVEFINTQDDKQNLVICYKWISI